MSGICPGVGLWYVGKYEYFAGMAVRRVDWALHGTVTATTDATNIRPAANILLILSVIISWISQSQQLQI